ncbi:MAG TPA: hypothetical protein VGO47_03210 [Chlamydiales bacterium]|jgi:hypothetical protein|nr:hypothetical protein [Chlamydiales bacterium]
MIGAVLLKGLFLEPPELGSVLFLGGDINLVYCPPKKDRKLAKTILKSDEAIFTERSLVNAEGTTFHSFFLSIRLSRQILSSFKKLKKLFP